MKKFLIILMCLVLTIGLAGCNNDDSEIETIDYFGMLVPYTPIEERDLPEWLRELKSEKSMMALERIFIGTLNNEVIYHLTVGIDSSLGGRFYDKDGNPLYFDGDFKDFIMQIHNVRCIYYNFFFETPRE